MKLNAVPLDAAGENTTARPPPMPTLEQRIDGQLWARTEDGEHPVVAHCCFPWSAPGLFISLRDPDNTEVTLIRDPADLDPNSRDALDGALATAGFAFQVAGIHEVEDEIEIRRWAVSTEQGARTFQTSRDSWPRELPGGGYVIRDVAGDLYHIGNPGELDASSRKLLWAFVE